MDEIYDQYYDTHYSQYNSPDQDTYEYMAKEYNVNYEQFLPYNKNAKILDVGSGIGHCIHYLKKIGIHKYLWH